MPPRRSIVSSPRRMGPRSAPELRVTAGGHSRRRRVRHRRLPRRHGARARCPRCRRNRPGNRDAISRRAGPDERLLGVATGSGAPAAGNEFAAYALLAPGEGDGPAAPFRKPLPGSANPPDQGVGLAVQVGHRDGVAGPALDHAGQVGLAVLGLGRSAKGLSEDKITCRSLC